MQTSNNYGLRSSPSVSGTCPNSFGNSSPVPGLSDSEADYAADMRQFGSGGGLNVAELRAMMQEDRDRDEREREECSNLLLLPDRRSGSGLDSGGSHTRTAKAFCSVCGFDVNPVGHGGRCRVRVRSPVEVSRVRRMAWLGDAAHAMDVRRYLLLTGVPDSQLEVRAQAYISQEAQARYFCTVDNPDVPAGGTSVARLSAAFEANYYGSFRAAYLQRTFPLRGQDFTVSWYLVPFITTVPFEH